MASADSSHSQSRLLKDYRIAGSINEGKYAKVVKAVRMDNDLICSVKILCRCFHPSPNLEDKKTYLDQIVKQIMPSDDYLLSHENILKHHQNFVEELTQDELNWARDLLRRADQSDETNFFNVPQGLDTLQLLFMENEPYVRDLRSFMALPDAHPHWSVKWCLEMIEQVASALKHMHFFGVVHRRIQPEHLVLTYVNYPNVLKIGDLEWAAFDGCLPDLDTDAMVSKPHYLAPEQWGDSYGREVDVYALGVVSFELLVFPQFLPKGPNPDLWPLRDAAHKFALEKRIPENAVITNKYIPPMLLHMINSNPAERIKLHSLLSHIKNLKKSGGLD